MAKQNKNFKPGKITKIKMPKTSGSWLTNAGKSLGLASMEVLSDVMPASVELTTNAAEFASNFRTHLTEMRAQKNRLKEAVEKNVYTDIAKTAYKNFWQDLKTGNLYQEMNYDDGLDDFNLDDSGFGDGDWDVGDDSDFDASFASEDGTTTVATRHSSDGDIDINRVNVNVDIGNNSKLINAMNQQTKVAVDSANVALEYSKAFDKTILSEFTNFSKSQTDLLSSIDKNISSIVQIGDNMAKTASLSAKYFDDSMAIFNTISSTLIEIKDRSVGGGITDPNMAQLAAKNKEKYGNVLDLIESGNGLINLEEYGKLVKKGFKTAVANDLILSTIANFVSDPDQIRAMVEHPWRLITTSFVNKLIPTMIKEAAGGFDRMLQEFFITGLYRVRGMKDGNPIKEFLAETFGITTGLKTDTDKSLYNRGKVDWTGESHKTLNEVIPYYLRIIAASVSGREEVAFNYNTGKFDKVGNLIKAYKDDDEATYTREFSGIISDFKDSLSKTVAFKDKEGQANAVKEFTRFLRDQVKQDGTKAYREKGSFGKFISEYVTDETTAQLIAGFLDNMNNAELTAMFGRNMIDARARVSKKHIDEESGVAASNIRYVDNGLDTPDQHLNKDNKGKIKGVGYKVSPFIERDEWGKSTLTYIRDIYSLLLNGIIVYPYVKTSPTSGRRRGRNGNPPSNSGVNIQSSLDFIRSTRDGLSSHYINGTAPASNSETTTQNTDEQLQAAADRGKLVVDNVSDQSIYEQFRQLDRDRREAAKDEDKEKGSELFSKLTGINPNKPMSKIFNKIGEYLQKPGKIGADLFKTADDFLFKLVFGSDEGNGAGVFNTAIAHVKAGLKNMSTWISDHIFDPLHENLFGDNGLFKQIQQSELGKALLARGGGLKKILFGEKNGEGIFSGGLFSEVGNIMTDIGRDIKFNLFAADNPNSLWSNMKDIGSSAAEFFTNGLTAMGGVKSDHPITDLLDSIHERITYRADLFSESLFGNIDTEGGGTFASQFKQDMKDAGFSKIAAGGAVGLLASLFLPGGPIVGAALGIGASMIRNSDALQTQLFGDIDEESGLRKGGLFSKDFMEAFDENKLGLAAGAGIGLLPSFFLPGGPVTGAILGMGTSMVFKSQVMQDFLFGGDTNEDGLLGKFKNVFKNAEGVTDKARFIDVGIGAGVGLIGSMFLPGGPLLMGTLGGLLGFGAGSEKFENFLFGEKGADGQRTGGIIAKAFNGVKNLFVPGIKRLQAGFTGFMEQKIVAPLITGLKPILNFGKNVAKGLATKVFDTVKWVGSGVKKFLIGDENGKGGVFSPLLNVGKKALELTGKLAENIISAPFRLIGAVGKALDLGTRLRNLLSPIIDGMIKPVLDIMKFAVKKAASLAVKAVANIVKGVITAPFKFIKFLFTGAKNILGGIGRFFINNTGVGKAVGAGIARYRQNRNSAYLGHNGAIPDAIRKASTTRKKWQKDPATGKWVFAEDKDYKYTNTRSGESIAAEYKRYRRESKEWELYNKAINGDKKAKAKLEKLYPDANIQDKLFGQGKGFSGDRRGFDSLLGHQSWTGSSKKSRAKYEESKKKEYENKQSVLTDRQVVKELSAQNVVVSKLEIKDKSTGQKLHNYFKAKDIYSKYQEEDLLSQLDGNDSAIKSANKAGKHSAAEKYFNKAGAAFNEGEMTPDQIKSYARHMGNEYAKKNGKAAGNRKRKEIYDELMAKMYPENKEGHMAFGGKVLETGKYWLSKGERVISNISGKLDDYKKEREARRRSKNVAGSFANKNTDVENDEAGNTRVANGYNIDKFNEEKERALEREETRSWREMILSKIEDATYVAANTTSRLTGLFGKKGVLGAAILAFTALFPELTGKLVAFVTQSLPGILEKTFGFLGGQLGKFAKAFENAGGITGVSNNIQQQGRELGKLISDDVAQEVVVNPDGTIATENGKVKYQKDEDEQGRNIFQKIKDYVLPEKTKIDMTGKITGKAGAAYTLENDYDSATESKINFAVVKSRPLMKFAKKASENKFVQWGVTRGKEVAKGFVDESVTLIKKFVGILKKALDFLIKHIDDFLAKRGAKSSGKILKVIKDIGDKLSDKGIGTLVKKFGKTVTEKLGKWATKIASAATTVLLSDVAMGLCGGLAGACNAENFFQCDFDSLSMGTKIKLRAISALWQGFAATSIGATLDLAFSLFFLITGYDPALAISELIFSIISSKEEEEALKNAQDDFTADYEEYVQEEYETYVKYQQENGNEVLDFDEFKSTVGTSFDDYNLNQHKTLGKRVWDGVTGAGRAVKNFFTGNPHKVETGTKVAVNNGENHMAFGGRVNKSGQYWLSEGERVIPNSSGKLEDYHNELALKRGEARGVQLYGKNTPSTIIHTLFSGAQNAMGSISGIFKDMDMYQKHMSSKITGIKSLLPNGEYWKSDINTDNPIVGVVEKGFKFFSLFSALPKAIAYDIKNGTFTPLVNSLKTIENDWKAGATIETNLFKDGSNIGSVLTTLFKAPSSQSDSAKSFPSLIGAFGFYMARITTLIPSIVSSSLTWIIDNVKKLPFGESIAKFITSVTGVEVDLEGEETGNQTNPTTNSNAQVTSTLKGSSNYISSLKDTIGFGGMGSPEMRNGFPYYSQKDANLKNKPYKVSSGTSMYDEDMGTRGCGPTALAMVASKLKGGFGNPYSPENMARLAEQGGYSTNYGTSPDYFTSVGSQLGMNVTPAVASSGNVYNMLASGQPVILQGKSKDSSSPFTSAGHYVVGTGMDGNGNVLVNDPNGRQKSKKYSLSNLTKYANLAFGFSNGYGGFGPNGMPSDVEQQMAKSNTNVKTFGKSKYGYNGMPTDVQNIMKSQQDRLQWLEVVRAVKQAIAAQKPGYSQTNYITITIGGKSLKVRTDCSGFTAACIKFYGRMDDGINMTSTDFTSANNSTMLNAGFSSYSWNGWEALQPGDIISKNGHVEIFSRNDGNRHYVYNCGSNDSVNNPGETTDNREYTTVWRPGPAGVAGISSGDISSSGYSGSSAVYGTNSTSGSTSGGNSGGLAGMLSKFASIAMSPIKKWLYGEDDGMSSDTSSVSTTHVSSSGNTHGGKSGKFDGGVNITSGVPEGTTVATIADADLSKLTGDSFMNSDIKTIPKLSQEQITKIINTSFANKGNSIYTTENAAEVAKGIFQAQQDTGVSAFVPLSIGALESGWGTSSIAKNKGNLWGWAAYNSSPGASATEFGGNSYEAFKGYTNKLISTYYDGYGAKSIYQIGSGNNPAGKGYAYSDGGQISQTWAPNVTKCFNGMVKRMGGLGDAIPKYNYSIIDSSESGGFGNYSIDKTLKNHDRRVKSSGGFGDADTSQVIGLLTSMLTEMKGTNEGINKFNDKDFSGMGSTYNNYFDNKTNLVNANGNTKPRETIRKPISNIDPAVYSVAKKIAAGMVTA